MACLYRHLGNNVFFSLFCSTTTKMRFFSSIWFVFWSIVKLTIENMPNWRYSFGFNIWSLKYGQYYIDKYMKVERISPLSTILTLQFVGGRSIISRKIKKKQWRHLISFYRSTTKHVYASILPFAIHMHFIWFTFGSKILDETSVCAYKINGNFPPSHFGSFERKVLCPKPIQFNSNFVV